MSQLLIVGIIFLAILLFFGIFISQQIYAIQKVRDARTPKSLMEKLSSKGIGALNTDKFREIVMSEGSDSGTESSVQPLFQGESSYQTGGVAGETPDETIFNEQLNLVGHPLNIENKDLQSIYSEYLSAKNINPFDVEPDFKLGVAYLKFSQHDKAQKQFLKVIESKPDFPGIYYYLGESYRCNGQFYEAMKSYKTSWEKEMTAHVEREVNK